MWLDPQVLENNGTKYIRGMDHLDGGTVLVDDRDISQYNEADTEYRRRDIGFVFQFYNLVQNLTAGECGWPPRSANPMDVEEVLEMVGLKDRMNNFPSQLSGGAAEVPSPALAKNQAILCDEPTGALDYKTGKSILKLLQDTCRSSV